MKEKKIYDLFLVASLIMSGINFNRLDIFERKWAYVFTDDNTLQDKIEQYYMGMLKLDPYELRNKRNALKNKIYREGGAEVENDWVKV